MSPTEHPSTQNHPRLAPPLAVTGRRLKLAAVIVALALIVGFLVTHVIRAHHEHEVTTATRSALAAPPPVETVRVVKTPPTIALRLPGTSAAWFESVIYPRVDGYVGQWNADIGDHVRKGQVLATIETPELDAQLAAAKAKLAAANAQVEFARSTYERWKDSPTGVVSQQEREAKKADYDTALAQRGLDQADVDRYKTLTSFKQVTAPYDGTITERRIDIGNLVTAGSTSGTTPLYKMVQDDPMRVFVDVPQSVAQDIADGLAVQVTASNLPGRTILGKVTRTADAISAQTRTLKVEVDIPNADHILKSGTYIDAAFDVPSRGAVEVPAAALVFRTGNPQVAVIGDDDRVDFRSVTIARDNGDVIELAAGLSEGTRVALNVGSQIAQGEKVTVQAAPDDGAAHASQ